MPLTVVSSTRMEVGTVVTNKGSNRSYVTVESVKWGPSPNYRNGAWRHRMRKATAEEVAEAMMRDAVEEVMND